MALYYNNSETGNIYQGSNLLGAIYNGTQQINPEAIQYISASGGTITYDGNYKIHTFTTTGSNTFTITQLSNISSYNIYDLLLVGGGGGGVASNVVGGGGAGGQVIYSQSLAFTTTGNYTANVGNGGGINTTMVYYLPTASTSLRGVKGTVSSFTGSGVSKEAFGGGPGCIVQLFPSSSAQATVEKIANGGGMGFGFSGSFSGDFPQISGSIGTVFNGGNYDGSIFIPSIEQSGGGSGASTSGSGNNGVLNPLPSDGANGVDGITVSISGTPTIYGGSGAGARSATGGAGGGGNSNSRGGDPGTDGLGGGGGGSLALSFSVPDAGEGGSGVVIIRYQYQS